MKLKIALIRHGQAEKIDNSLLGESSKKIIREKRAAKDYPMLKHVYACEHVCCRDTASLIYQVPAVILKKLCASNPVNSDRQALQERLNDKASFNIGSFYDVGIKAGNTVRQIGKEMAIKKAEQCALISCKMVMLEILRRYCVPRSSYEDWELPFGGGYLIEYDTVEEIAKVIRKI